MCNLLYQSFSNFLRSYNTPFFGTGGMLSVGASGPNIRPMGPGSLLL
jgi:hypothetical protein